MRTDYVVYTVLVSGMSCSLPTNQHIEHGPI